MKKSTPKTKAAQGCMKISSFFSKNPRSPKCPVSTSESVNIVSDDEQSESLLNYKSTKRKNEDTVTGRSPPVKKSSYDMPSTSGNVQIYKSAQLVPSTCGSTPLKSTISVKTPEKLLNSAALKAYNEKSSDEPKHVTPVKIIKLEKTPDKRMSSSSRGSMSDSTPIKVKKTPKKLFDKSPTNLKEFNVELLEKFVKITPSKREVEDTKGKRSLEVQLQNEKTPTKDIVPSNMPSPLKAKTQLDFSCEQPSSEKENCDLLNISVEFDDDWEAEFIDQVEYNLDLTQSQHCRIVSITQKSREVIIAVKSTQNDEQALCSLQGFWLHSQLCIGDTIHLQGMKNEDTWFVDNEVGFLVFEPDLLISTTSIVNSVFCKRQALFKERFRGFEPTSKYMILGNMVHTLLQEVLRKKLYQKQEILKQAQDILGQKELLLQIYQSGETLEFINEEFMKYIPKVYDFVENYVDRSNFTPRKVKKDDWKGHITGIEDIEENIWCPDLGVKGKVDVSVKNGHSIMPLEVKTGRASVSLEHRGQVLLYIMMMNKLGYPVSNGLLLYLKEGILKEIPPTAAEKRDIIILRNELAYYLSQSPKTCTGDDGVKYLEPVEVPETANHPFCAKCPYNAVCMAYSKYHGEDVSKKKSLSQVHNQLSTYLTSTHIDYFMQWASLLSIENPERSTAKGIRDIYTLTPEERKSKGKCLIDLSIEKIIEENGGTCVTTFTQTADLCNFLSSGLGENCYVVVSVQSRPAVATGFVQDISVDSITISLDRNLNKKYHKQFFHVDAYDSTTFLTYNMASLALILDSEERTCQLRSIIIDRQPATFQPKLPKTLAEKARPILKRLNKVQQRAVLKAIAANEYFLIKGMPGTGKTATIVALIELLVKMDKTVLITSHTHSAVNTVCLKLIQFGVKFMRLGSEAKMDAQLRNYSEHSMIRHCTTTQQLEEVYNSVQVVAVTCMGSGHALLSKKLIDVCIVDESTQVLQCSVFRPLLAAKTFVLIGDPDQLPAVVRNKTALELGMSESLFERLDSDESRISLNINYRMNEPITKLANDLTYGGELQIGADRVAKACLQLPNAVRTQFKWVSKALDTSMENAVQFIDTGATWNLERTVSWQQSENFSEDSQEVNKCVNIFEAAVIFHLVKTLIDAGVKSSNIGVIATYRVQVALLAQILNRANVYVSTVDQFQGKDSNIIIYSCSKSKDLSEGWKENKFDLTEDKRRLNVAITRAKHKLILVGDLETLKNYSTFKKIAEALEKNVIRLPDVEGFDWDEIISIDL